MNKIVIMIIKISFIITIFWHNEELYTFHLMTVEMLKISHTKKNKRKPAKRLLITLLLKTHGKRNKRPYPGFSANPKIDQIGHFNCPWVKKKKKQKNRRKWSSACQKQEGQKVFIVRHGPILKHLLSACQRLSHCKKPLVEWRVFFCISRMCQITHKTRERKKWYYTLSIKVKARSNMLYITRVAN